MHVILFNFKVGIFLALSYWSHISLLHPKTIQFLKVNNDQEVINVAIVYVLETYLFKTIILVRLLYLNIRKLNSDNWTIYICSISWVWLFLALFIMLPLFKGTRLYDYAALTIRRCVIIRSHKELLCSCSCLSRLELQGILMQ